MVDDEVTLCNQACVEFRMVRHSLKIWRLKLSAAKAEWAEAQCKVQRLRDVKSAWQLMDEPGEFQRPAHWRPPVRGRSGTGAREFTSLASSIAWLQGLLLRCNAGDCLVRADGSETTSVDVLHQWSYVSLHVLKRPAAVPVFERLIVGWPRPAWAVMTQVESKSEALLTAFLTIGQTSRCALHCDNVATAWLVTAGSRTLWVLPPHAARDALPDVQAGYSTERDSFSAYSPFEDEHRHAAWKCVTLAVGDWVYMPRGWWHVVESSPGSVMFNIRVPIL